MDNKNSRRQNIFFQNLLALGFDTVSMTKEHKIIFDKKIFALPNKKGFEVVSHFLFSKLNEVSGGKYNVIWPLFDAKDQRLFQKTVFDYLSRIAQESEIRFPLVLNSVVSSFGGEAFFDLYFAFSTHVVQQVNKTFGPMLRRPKFHAKFSKLAIEMQKMASIDCVEKFQVLTDTTKFHLETYFHIAKKLTDCVERLKLSNSKSQSLLEELIKTAIKIISQRSNTLENSLEGLIIRNKEYQNKVEVLWKKFEDFLSTEKNLWNCISSELEDNTKFILRGSACSITLSNNLKNSYEKRYETEMPEEKSNLSIPRFLKLFSLVLELYIDSIKRGKFSETYELQCLKDTSELDKSLKMLQSFCALLEEGNVKNKKCVDVLMEKINLDYFNEDKSDFIGDLPPSPKKCLEENADSLNANEFVFSHPFIHDLKLGETAEQVPEVDSSMKQFDHTSDEVFSVFSPIQIEERSSVNFLNSELLHSGLNHSATAESYNQTSVKSSATKDSVLNFPKFDIPLSWLHEESLNSQTLSEEASFSFLD